MNALANANGNHLSVAVNATLRRTDRENTPTPTRGLQCATSSTNSFMFPGTLGIHVLLASCPADARLQPPAARSAACSFPFRAEGAPTAGCKPKLGASSTSCAWTPGCSPVTPRVPKALVWTGQDFEFLERAHSVAAS